jgi:hypothetical protein
MDKIRLELTQNEYQSMLIMLGFARASASKHDPELATIFLRHINHLNRHQTTFHPYYIAPETAPTTLSIVAHVQHLQAQTRGFTFTKDEANGIVQELEQLIMNVQRATAPY